MLGGEYSIRSEVWSVGISVLEMALGRFPYCKVQSKLLSVLLGTKFIAFLTALLPTNGLRPFQLCILGQVVRKVDALDSNFFNCPRKHKKLWHPRY